MTLITHKEEMEVKVSKVQGTAAEKNKAVKADREELVTLERIYDRALSLGDIFTGLTDKEKDNYPKIDELIDKNVDLVVEALDRYNFGSNKIVEVVMLENKTNAKRLPRLIIYREMSVPYTEMYKYYKLSTLKKLQYAQDAFDKAIEEESTDIVYKVATTVVVRGKVFAEFELDHFNEKESIMNNKLHRGKAIVVELDCATKLDIQNTTTTGSTVLRAIDIVEGLIQSGVLGNWNCYKELTNNMLIKLGRNDRNISGMLLNRLK